MITNKQMMQMNDDEFDFCLVCIEKIWPKKINLYIVQFF
jgi:hypothetical protein